MKHIYMYIVPNKKYIYIELHRKQLREKQEIHELNGTFTRRSSRYPNCFRRIEYSDQT